MRKIAVRNPDTYTLKRCELFAQFSAQTSQDEYARRNQVNLEKIKKDIYQGKIAEFMVSIYYAKLGKKVSVPDLEIYGKYRKSFDADLVINGTNVHVKSCAANPRWSPSWVFQKNDKITQGETEDWLCLVVLEEGGGGWFSVYQAKSLKFKPPRLEYLRDSKTCLYWDDLKG